MAKRRLENETRKSHSECSYCGQMVPDDAMRCPHCKKWYSPAKKLAALVIVIIVVSASMGYIGLTVYSGGHAPFLGDIFNGGDTSNTSGGSTTTITNVIEFEIWTSLRPITAKNFKDIANQGLYNSVPFHRVIDNFMIQGGDFTNGDGTGGHAAEWHGVGFGDQNSPNSWTIPDEYDYLNTNSVYNQHNRGVVSMAKTSAPNSGGSQFFIVQAADGAHHLDGVHTVFGQVTKGMDLVDKIAKVAKDSNDRPLNPVTMSSVTIFESGGKQYARIVVSGV